MIETVTAEVLVLPPSVTVPGERTVKRFSQMPPGGAQAFHDYASSFFRHRGSGEYALAYILAPGAFALSPLMRHFGGAGHSIMKPDASNLVSGDAPTAPETWEPGIPVVLMYGEKAWMDVNGGRAAVGLLNEATAKAKREAPTRVPARDETTEPGVFGGSRFAARKASALREYHAAHGGEPPLCEVAGR